jgi:hypothetical protein
MSDPNLANKIIQSIEQSDFNWRTKSGIASELDLSSDEIADVLAKSDSFVKSKVANEKGEELYTTVDRYKRNTPLLKRVLGAAANTVIS